MMADSRLTHLQLQTTSIQLEQRNKLCILLTKHLNLYLRQHNPSLYQRGSPKASFTSSTRLYPQSSDQAERIPHSLVTAYSTLSQSCFFKQNLNIQLVLLKLSISISYTKALPPVSKSRRPKRFTSCHQCCTGDLCNDVCGQNSNFFIY